MNVSFQEFKGKDTSFAHEFVEAERAPEEASLMSKVRENYFGGARKSELAGGLNWLGV